MSFQLIAAPHTPFRPDGGLNLPVIARQAEHLRRTGLDGVFVCGTNGEGMSLAGDERRAVAAEWARAGALPVIAHVGHASQREAAELARHAEGVGAVGVAAVAPFYHRPADEAATVDWLAGVAAAAPRTPFYFYDMPGFTGVRLRTDLVMRLAADRIPTFAGVKFTNPDLVLLQECVAEGRVLFGCDELLLAAATLGVTGAVGGTYNLMAPLYRRILAADPAEARRLQLQAVRIVRVLEQFGGVAAGKAAMALVGVDCGPARPPLRTVDAEALRVALEQVGFFG